MELNWDSLSFDFNETGGENLRQYYRDGRWSEPEYTTSEYIPVHMCSACLNYGLQAFEGIKAFRGVDGRVRLFRPDAHARRMAAGARKLCLPMPSEQMFDEIRLPLGSVLPLRSAGRIQRKDKYRFTMILLFIHLGRYKHHRGI